MEKLNINIYFINGDIIILYFPYDVECPINDIIIDNNNVNYIDYKEIKLTNNTLLYYTNK